MSDARRSILETAGRLFAERGYELVGINEIIAKSGVAKATFYSHFPSKERLCAEWLRGAAAEATARYRACLADPRPAGEKVRERFESLHGYLSTCDYRGCPFSITASMTDPSSEVREVIRGYKAEARQFWQALAGQLRPDWDDEAQRRLGDGLFLLFSGAVSEAQNARDDWPVESAVGLLDQLCPNLAGVAG